MARKKTRTIAGGINPPRAPSNPPGGAYWTCLPIFHQPPNKCQDQTQNLPWALEFFSRARYTSVKRRQVESDRHDPRNTCRCGTLSPHPDIGRYWTPYTRARGCSS